MKKILSLLTLLVAVCSGAWADAITIFDAAEFTSGFGKGNTIEVGSVTYYGQGSNDSGGTIGGIAWSKRVKFGGGSTFQTGKTFDRVIALDIAAAGTINIYFASGSSNSSRNVYVSKAPSSTNRDTSTAIGSASDGGTGTGSVANITADAAGTYYVWCVENIAIYGITFEKAGPKITTQPVGASYATGQTIAALTVAATASAGNLSYQWYKNNTNSATVDDDHKISGATESSYTPTEAGFYYVVVTDGKGSVTSDVAEITISAAEAPTINVSDAPVDAVKVGTEVILTATATGVPTPALQWYSNTTASNTDGTAIDGATDATYAPSTATAGTYYYYAVATNSEGEATSAVQTIVVKEQVATPTFTPNGAYFEISQEVTLACTTDGATIKYSTDNGATWTDYTTALNFSETTTVQAKATKDDYIDSEVATATFNKVTLDAWTNVTGAATWDWSKFGTKEIKLTDSTTPKKNDEFVLSNVVNYGYCSSISSEFGDAQALKVSGEYAVRDTKYFQGGFVKFHPTVAGKLSVTYSNTGNRDDENLRRFLNVNGTNYGEGTLTATAITTSDIYVPANNDVTIKGTLKGDGSDQYLRINKIEFTPLIETTVAVSDKLYRTFASKYPTTWGNISGLTAYKATVTGDNVTFEEVTGSVPAGEGLLLKATEAKTYTVPVSSTLPDDIENALVGVTKETTVDGAGIFVLYADDTHPIGFYKTEATSFTVGANTAYLPANTSARTFIALDEETTGIGATLMNSEKVNSEVYNLNGQRVMNPAKGLYIVNGKKVVIK